MKKLFILIMGLYMLAGCEDFLDIKPVTEQPDTEVLTLKSNVQSVLNAAYDRIQSDQFLSGRAVLAAELYGDNIDLTTTNLVSSQDYGPFASRNFGIFNNVSRNVWTTGYNAIYNANIVLRAVNDGLITDATPDEQTLLKAEAYFIRGLAHHTLVRLFALPYSNNPTADAGVIIRITAPSSEEALTPEDRSTVEQVYAQVISDLKEAEQLLPSLNSGRATTWMAKALLARVYFDMADYTNAYTYSNDVITNGSLTLGANVTTVFRNSGATQSDGAALQIVNIPSDDASGAAEGLRSRYWSTTAANVLMPMDAGIVSAFDPADNRLKMLINVPTLPDKPYSLKFQGSNAVNIPIIRLAEMYLTRAESAVMNGGYVDADVRADYNILRTFAGLPADDVSSSSAELLDAIQSERRFELAMEGDRYFELRRLKKDIRGLAYNDPAQLLKIPDSETRANPTIVQN
jgi:hypothetical protein